MWNVNFENINPWVTLKWWIYFVFWSSCLDYVVDSQNISVYWHCSILSPRGGSKAPIADTPCTSDTGLKGP